LTIRGLEVEVLEADERRIIRLRVKKAQLEETEEESKAQTT
jgi:Mg2+/Co2+ transporter CorC